MAGSSMIFHKSPQKWGIFHKFKQPNTLKINIVEVVEVVERKTWVPYKNKFVGRTKATKWIILPYP
jgi:hypothetical protein